MSDLISKLSELRSQYNCFDEHERDAYHTLSEAIKVLSAQSESHDKRTETHSCDTISRQAAIDALYREIIKRRLLDEMYDGALDEFQTEEILRKLSPAQPEQRWIPCSEMLPENRDWVLGIFQEGDTGWINPIPFICDYVGKKTPITTQDNWLLKLVDEPHPYYERLHCIAWMPLPEPYREEGETDALD